VDDVDVDLQEVVQRYVVIFVVGQLPLSQLSLLDHSVRNLGVKHKVAVKVVLVDQGRLIFAEVMEDLHDTL
jgi:hypothetical protein